MTTLIGQLYIFDTAKSQFYFSPALGVPKQIRKVRLDWLKKSRLISDNRY